MAVSGLMNKYLIIRFSSFGDIAQALASVPAIYQLDDSSEIHWLTRSDFAEFVSASDPRIKVWSLDRKTGVKGLLKLSLLLVKQNFTYLYDAHNNLRSNVLTSILFLLSPKIKVETRSKNRFKRILLFQFRYNLFSKPFRGMISYLEPLSKWLPKKVEATEPHLLLFAKTHFKLQFLKSPQAATLSEVLKKNQITWQLKDIILLAPSATWELKKWPTSYWSELIQKSPDKKFLILGGAEDSFCAEIAFQYSDRARNLAGQLSWLQSTILIAQTRLLIAADTGLLHVADLMASPALALIGPTAFGFPSRDTSHVIEIPLSCRPCTKDGRGKCTNSVYKKCLVDILPSTVIRALNELP